MMRLINAADMARTIRGALKYDAKSRDDLNVSEFSGAMHLETGAAYIDFHANGREYTVIVYEKGRIKG